MTDNLIFEFTDVEKRKTLIKGDYINFFKQTIANEQNLTRAFVPRDRRVVVSYKLCNYVNLYGIVNSVNFCNDCNLGQFNCLFNSQEFLR